MRFTFLLALAACSAAPPALLGPAVQPRVSQHATATASNTPAAGLRVTVELHCVRKLAVGTPLESEVAVIAAQAGAPFRGAAPLAGTVALAAATAADWRARAHLQPLAAGERHPQETLLLGQTAPFAVGNTATTRLQWQFARATAPGQKPPDLQFGSDGEHLEVALLVPDPEQATAAELRILLRPSEDAVRGWFTPVAFVADRRDAIAGFVTIVRVLGPADAEELASLAASRAGDSGPAPAAVDAAAQLLASQQQLVAASIGAQSRRGALLALANRARDAALVDALVVADERTLIAISHAVTADSPPADAAWTFAQEVWGSLVAQMQRNDVAAGMRACLRRHFGALGSDPTGLGDLLQRSRDLATFWSAVQEENVQALADRELAVRVHAHDWLLARQAAVADYDPMATANARRHALRQRAMQQQAKPEPDPASGRHR